MDAASLRPLAIGEILDVAIKIYRSRFRTLVKATAAVVVPVLFVGALVQFSVLPDADAFGPAATVETDAGEFTTPEDEVDFDGLWAFLAATLVVGFLAFVATQLATAASFKIVSGAYLDENPDWRESLRFARERLGSLVWLSILLGLLLVLAFLACIAPGVYFYGAWAVAVPVLLFEDARGRKALARSRQLVQGRWWPSFAVIVLAAILSGVVSGLFAGLATAVIAVGGNDVVYALVNAIGNAVGTMLTTPFAAAVTAVLYFDLRVRKEGFDLELLARHVGVDPPAGGDGRWGETPAGGGAGDSLFPPLPPSGEQPPFWPPPPGWRPQDG